MTTPIYGMIFEDIICIDFSHFDWEIDPSSPPEVLAMAGSEDEVPAGLETSEGFDFGQYRVSISLVDSNTDLSTYDNYGA